MTNALDILDLLKPHAAKSENDGSLLSRCFGEITVLRGNLSLAEEGLANATQEIHQLRTALGNLTNGYKYPAEVCEIARKALSGSSEPLPCAHAFGTDRLCIHCRVAECACVFNDTHGIHALTCRHYVPSRGASRDASSALAHSADIRQEIKGKGDVPDSQYAGILKAAESGDAVNTMDLVNALWWRVGNQRREIARLSKRTFE